jgi:hypothetical protein
MSVSISLYRCQATDRHKRYRGKEYTGNNNEFLEACFSVQSLWYERAVGDYFFPELLVKIMFK